MPFSLLSIFRGIRKSFRAMTNLNKKTQAPMPIVRVQQQELPIRGHPVTDTDASMDPPPYDAQPSPIDLQLHHIVSKDALVVKIQPPKVPPKPISHVACDVVLVIDISGSMLVCPGAR